MMLCAVWEWCAVQMGAVIRVEWPVCIDVRFLPCVRPIHPINPRRVCASPHIFLLIHRLTPTSLAPWAMQSMWWR
jgi:hypothetical protein